MRCKKALRNDEGDITIYTCFLVVGIVGDIESVLQTIQSNPELSKQILQVLLASAVNVN
jgi:hypothetical protein